MKSFLSARASALGYFGVFLNARASSTTRVGSGGLESFLNARASSTTHVGIDGLESFLNMHAHLQQRA